MSSVVFDLSYVLNGWFNANFVPIVPGYRYKSRNSDTSWVLDLQTDLDVIRLIKA